MTYTSLVKTISISKLKAHLSAELKGVQAGESLLVMDRDTPVAVLSPYVAPREFKVIPPKGPLVLERSGITVTTDPLVFLLEDRAKR